MNDVGIQGKPICLVSDFNISVLGRCLESDEHGPSLAVSVGPFGNLMPSLLSGPARDAEFAVVWSQPAAAAPTFGEVLQCQPTSLETILGEVDAFAEALRSYAGSLRAVVVPTWSIPAQHRGYGPLDFKPGVGLRQTLARMNLRLADAVAGVTNIFLLDTNRWLQNIGPRAYDPRLWFAAKSPFSLDLYAEAAGDIRAVLRAVEGETRKLVVLDLDNTLWGGVIGEAGADGITLGGHDPIGEAYSAFQSALVALKNRGVLLAIASKNEEAVAMEAIRRHPEMRLRPDDFAAYRINWDDKAGNIASLVEELNIGLQSVVFIDDNPAERGRVQEALPEVLVPDWPVNPMDYEAALQALPCFDQTTVSTEDANRTEMYVAERTRTAARKTVGSVEVWLESLGLEVEIEVLGPANLARAAQLLNKTNQMNLRTRRLAPKELQEWAAGPGRQTKTFRVRDRYGDSGITGLLSVEQRGSVLGIVDLVLSCRVFGRRIEQLMIGEALAEGRQRGCLTLQARYRRTPKNGPCLSFLESLGFDTISPESFEWPVDRSFALPSSIKVRRAASRDAVLQSPKV